VVDAYVKMLEKFGVGLGHPYSSDIRRVINFTNT
jgi:hypothetical protein